MKTSLRAVVTLVVTVLTSSPVWAHHISGFVYCDDNRSGVIEPADDSPLEGVSVKVASNTLPNPTFFDTTDAAGLYFVDLPSISDNYSAELTGLPAGWTVIIPAGGVYPNLPIITCNGCPTNKIDNLNFLVDGCQPASCGDGITQPGLGETCDPPGSPQAPNNNPCRDNCTYCGDGNVDAGEACDDANDNNTDGCTNECKVPTCGDGIVSPPETCDPPFSPQPPNGNPCSATCTYCGDGNVDAGEVCDDRNSDNTDRCLNTCAEPFCGDGFIQPGLGEQCDPAPPSSSPDCDATCHLSLEICTDLVDNDGDGQIDCLDPDCNCLPIGRDPGRIRFGRAGTKSDLFQVHGALYPVTPIDPATEEISILLTNANGEIFQLKVPAGSLKLLGRNLHRFRDRAAQKAHSGLAKFDLLYVPSLNRYVFTFKTYGDLSKATEAVMALQIVVGDDPFLNPPTAWDKLPKGWLLTLPKL